MSRTLKLTLSYDGTAYLGWQRQASGISIQALVEEALTRIEGEPVTIDGAGRTDAGVHALGQVASANVATTLDLPTLKRALNATLPPDVRVVSVEEAAADFHARYSATGKTYEYWIWQGDVVPPFLRTSCWQIPRVLDVTAMDQAARLLEGVHDFGAFQSAGGSVKTTVRRVQLARVEPGGLPHAVALSHVGAALGAFGGQPLVFRITAAGFLRHMVRALVGTLVEVGDRRREADSLRRLLEGGARGEAGPTAPARGLVLVSVDYGPGGGASRELSVR